MSDSIDTGTAPMDNPEVPDVPDYPPEPEEPETGLVERIRKKASRLWKRVSG